MKSGTLAIIGAAIGAAGAQALKVPFPPAGGNPYLDLIAHHDPGLHAAVRVWHHAWPAVLVVLAGSFVLSVWWVWFQPLFRLRRRGKLPAWPASAEDEAPSLVIGELHHPTAPRESERPSWLVIPEKGLYTGTLIVGAVGTGKTSGCMYPFARQILSWRADDTGRRAGALRDVYRCTVDAELLANKIGEARKLCPVRVTIANKDLTAHKQVLEGWAWELAPETARVACGLDPALRAKLEELGVPYETETAGAESELAEQVEAIERWYVHDWSVLDAKLRTLIEGISVFLSLVRPARGRGRVLSAAARRDGGRRTGRGGPGRPAHAGTPATAAAARATDRPRQGPRPQHARGRQPGRSDARSACCSRTPGCRRCCGAPLRPPAGPDATSGPPCSSATSTSPYKYRPARFREIPNSK